MNTWYRFRQWLADKIAPPSVGVIPPAPDFVALAMIQGMMANPKAGDDPQAIIGQAWAAVPVFYTWRQKYAEQIAPMFFVHTSDLSAVVAVSDGFEEVRSRMAGMQGHASIDLGALMARQRLQEEGLDQPSSEFGAPETLPRPSRSN